MSGIDKELLFQLFLVGDSGAGKSSLLTRLVHGTYTELYRPTNGVSFRTWAIPLEGKTIKLQIYDVPGREEYRTAIPDYYKRAQGFIIVFDLTDETSLSGVNDWLVELEKLANKNVTKILVGNKRDMQAERAIHLEVAEELAKKWGINFLEASAKDGTNVAQMFAGIAADIKNRLYPTVNEPRKSTGYVEIKRRLESIDLRGPGRPGSQVPVPPKKSQRQPCDYNFNIILLGDSAVGKSSLMLRFTDDHFSGLYIKVTGLDFKTKTVEVEGHMVKLLITDTSGQERFRALTSSFYRGADGIIIVYDVTCLESFINLKMWLNEIDTYARGDTNKILVGTKSDLTEKAVSHRTGEKFAKQLGIPFFEASAKSAENVEEVFKTIAALIKRRVGPPRNRNINGSRVDLILVDAQKKQRRRRC